MGITSPNSKFLHPDSIILYPICNANKNFQDYLPHIFEQNSFVWNHGKPRYVSGENYLGM